MAVNFDSPKLENQVSFPLYACSREVIKLYKPFLDSLNLTYTQYITMLVLWEKKSINVKALGSILYLDSGTLTPLLKKLEAKGLVTRKRSSEDERNLIVSITEAGEQMRCKATGVPEQVLTQSCLSQKEYDALQRILNKLLDGCK